VWGRKETDTEGGSVKRKKKKKKKESKQNRPQNK
jgi:hypothetical protein